MKKLYPLALLTCLNTPMAMQPHQHIVPIANAQAPSLGKFTILHVQHVDENTDHLWLNDTNTGENLDVWAENNKGHRACKIREYPTYQTRTTPYKKIKMVIFCLTAVVATLFFLAAIGQYIYNHLLKKVYFISPVGMLIGFPTIQTAWEWYKPACR